MAPISTLLFPVVCPGCGQRGTVPCASCASSCDRAPELEPIAHVDDLFAALRYDGVARELIVALKYRNGRAAIPWLASCLVAQLRHRWSAEHFGAVTWIPASKTRRRQRGFDQGQLLASEVATQLRVPAQSLLLRSGSQQQTGAHRSQRLIGPPLRPRQLAAGRARFGQRVLLIDDVITTGASIAAAAQVLHSMGAAGIYAATVAATPPGRAIPPVRAGPNGRFVSAEPFSQPELGKRS